MSWMDMLTDDRRRRVEQILEYEDNYSYDLSSDQYLICDMARWFDIKEKNHESFAEKFTPWWIKIIQSQSRHAYTCRLFKRVDFLLLSLMLKKPRWKNGRLFTGRYEARTIFPMSWYRWAADIQNKRVWTRIILNV